MVRQELGELLSDAELAEIALQYATPTDGFPPRHGYRVVQSLLAHIRAQARCLNDACKEHAECARKRLAVKRVGRLTEEGDRLRTALELCVEHQEAVIRRVGGGLSPERQAHYLEETEPLRTARLALDGAPHA